MKKYYILTASFFVLLILSSNVVAGGYAMFGLKWGMSPEQVKKLNVILTHHHSNNNFHFYRTESLPKSLKDVDFYILLFDENKSLVKIVMATKNTSGDAYGIEGKKRFSEIESLLKKKYKSIDSYKVVGKKLYDEPDEFYQCLKYQGCGMWYSTFLADNKNMALQLNGIKRGNGFIDLTVQAKPLFYQALDKFKSINALKEKDAL